MLLMVFYGGLSLMMIWGFFKWFDLKNTGNSASEMFFGLSIFEDAMVILGTAKKKQQEWRLKNP